MDKPNNPPAFPVKSMLESGMTLLDYFAGQAMQGFIMNEGLKGLIDEISVEGFSEKIAAGAYKVAQAMLKEREKHL